MKIGDQCQVKWRDGTEKLAKVVERRPINYRKRKKKNGTAALDTDSLSLDGNDVGEGKDMFKNFKADQVEYYVHFIDYDR